VNAVVAAAVAAMKKAGAVVVEVDDPALGAAKLIAENDVQKYEFKSLINAYLASIPAAPAKSLDEIIASGKFHKASLESFLKSAQARLWDADGDQELAVLKGHETDVSTAAFSADGWRVVTTTGENLWVKTTAYPPRLWDVESGKELAVLTGHAGIVWGANVQRGRPACSY
jgi:WD40 repeat protein